MENNILEYLFKGFVAVIMSLSLFIFNGFGDSIAKMQESINTLNVNFASFSEKLISSEKERDRLESRISRIELICNRNNNCQTRQDKE